ncbi:MAG: ABC-type transport auxiliary lipoprotein family protein [Pseudomonadota bacterium]
MSRHAIRRAARSATRACALAATLLALAGCGILPKRETLSLYRPEPAIAGESGTVGPRLRWQLQIARPHADAAYDTARILVRPRPGELQVYKGAAWTQPAPDLVHDILLRAFVDSARFAGVARRGEGIAADYELLLDLRRFESDYADGDRPRARIELGATLVHNADNRVVANRVFAADMPADAGDVARVNRAFEQGLGTIASQLVGWTAEEGQRDAARKR